MILRWRTAGNHAARNHAIASGDANHGGVEQRAKSRAANLKAGRPTGSVGESLFGAIPVGRRSFGGASGDADVRRLARPDLPARNARSHHYRVLPAIHDMLH